MARVRDISASELSPELADIYERYRSSYGPFGHQVAVFAHVPAALRHLMPMLMELREAATLPRRHLELAIVTVSKLNGCDYCVGHHAPFLRIEGLSDAGIARLPDWRGHPELDELDRLVVEYSTLAWNDSRRVPQRLVDALRRHYSEAQLVELTLRITLTGFFNRFSNVLHIDEEEVVHG